jgi:signal recognition particle subunit SRP68
MFLKAIIAENDQPATGSAQCHVVSRLHKAQEHAFELCSLLLSDESGASELDILEATAYASSLKGAEEFERRRWEASLKAFAVSRMVYAVLFSQTKNEMYKEQLSATVDPSVRYSAYQLQLRRSMDMVSICRQFFPRDNYSKIVEILEKQDPQVFADKADADGTGAATVNTVTWRGRSAAVEEADISVALSNAKNAETNYDSLHQPGSTDAFDSVLLAWQDAVDATRKAIDDRQADGISMAEQKMQNLQLTWTVVNYSMICWRVGRNRAMVENIDVRPRNPKKTADISAKTRVKNVGDLKEEIALCDAILQV